MNKENLAIATITWARDEEEAQLLKESLEVLSKLNIPVFITDGGSTDGFVDFLKSFPHFTVLKANAKGVWAQAFTSLSAAYQSNASFIFYTEPDKKNFFENYFKEVINQANEGDQQGIILASRTKEGFSTFPAFQQMTETTINNCCNQVIGKEVDYTYGPFILNKKLVPFLNLIQEDIGWGWRPYIFNIAQRLGYRIDAFEQNFTCPPDQRQDNGKERIYRMKQLQQNIQGIVLSTNVDLS